MRRPPAVARVLERVTATVREHDMLHPDETVLIMVSGGPDSVCLLESLVRLRRLFRVRLEVFHFDHRLRPGSAADGAYVGRAAARHDLPFHQRAATDAPERGGSVEAWATARRGGAADDVAGEIGASVIAEGHTLDDQAETVLLNLLRGAGPSGLAGIPPVRGNIIRPLLGLARAEVLEYCAAAGLGYREDKSNLDRRFTRNRIRHDIMPALREIQPNLTAVLSRLAEIMRAENEYLDALAAPWGRLPVCRAQVTLPLATLTSLPLALQRRLLRAALARVKGDARDLELERIDALIELVEQGRTGAMIELPEGLLATRGYGELVISRAQSPAAVSGEWPLSVPGTTMIPELGLCISATPSDDTTLRDDPNVAVLDADTVGEGLLVRFWRPGDRFVPLGLSEPVKLQDYFVNAKVPRRERDRIPIVESARHILWLVGHRIDDRSKVTSATRRTLRLQVTPLDL